jgi:FkbM family methyltransferase
MERFLLKAAHLPDFCIRQARSHLNAFRLGFFFVRVRSFKMPQKVNVAGTTIPLHYPPEHGIVSDFFGCCIGNEYGLRQRLTNVRTILDVGANVGFFSIAARSRYPQAKIHAYEPNPRALPFLKSNAEPLRISIYPEAVGADTGFVSILDIGDSNQTRTVSGGNGGIPQVSLACAIERLGGTVDLLKLDCEGAEWEMFRSAAPWQNVRNVRMEYHLFQGQTVQDVEQALSRLGFEVIHWRSDLGFGMVWATRRN